MVARVVHWKVLSVLVISNLGNVSNFGNVSDFGNLKVCIEAVLT
jgi:hypothetical protein